MYTFNKKSNQLQCVLVKQVDPRTKEDTLKMLQLYAYIKEKYTKVLSMQSK